MLFFLILHGDKKNKSQNLMNTSTKHFVFESEGKAVPLMKITKVLTDLFLL